MAVVFMYIEKCTNNGTSYLRLVESYRAPNSKGVKVYGIDTGDKKKAVKTINI